MRYIRTEEGFIIDTQNTSPFILVDGYIDFNSMGRFKIKKEADKIEDLCDCFVDYCEEDDSHFVYTIVQGVHEIYGAIWTDRGLTYVAKMNEKGEFELLEKEREK